MLIDMLLYRNVHCIEAPPKKLRFISHIRQNLFYLCRRAKSLLLILHIQGQLINQVIMDGDGPVLNLAVFQLLPETDFKICPYI